MAGLTLDSGALIGVERNDRRVVAHLKAALASNVAITVPTVVVAEVWRGGPRAQPISAVLKGCVIEPIDESMAKGAGEALAAMRGGTTIDALVMASAARRGDEVLTSDIDDLSRFGAAFPNVSLVSI